jgi:hypothetical protein
MLSPVSVTKYDPIYYQPSGKYKPKAPIIVFIVVFILLSITGIVCGLTLSEYGLFKYFDLTGVPFFIPFFLYCDSIITLKLVKYLQIRNPDMVFKIGLISASLGSIIFNLTTKYLKLSGLKLSFIDFYIERLTNGFPAGITIGNESGGGTINFHAPWFIAIPMLLFEL